MSLFLGVRTGKELTGSLLLDCPACHAANVCAPSYTWWEQVVLLKAIPLTRRSFSYWLTCPSCKETLQSSLPPTDLAALSPEQLKEYIRHRASPIKRLLAVLAILLFYMPLFGLTLATGAFIVNYKSQLWSRKVSLVALILSSICHVLFLALMLLNPSPYSH